MTNEQKFKAVYPRATVEIQRENGPGGKRYYLVRKSRTEYMYSGCGDTKAQAWASAVKSLSDWVTCSDANESKAEYADSQPEEK